MGVGRRHRSVHTRRQVRGRRAQGLRRKRADADRLCEGRARGPRPGDRPLPGTVTMTRPTPRGFADIACWVFDLDNTLYPHDLNLWQQIDERIRAYVSDLLKLSGDEAFRVQKDYHQRYGTTMRGLMTEHGIDPDGYLEFVHQIDHSPLEPNPALGAALERLPGRKLILTNGTKKHADAVMQRLAVHS